MDCISGPNVLRHKSHRPLRDSLYHHDLEYSSAVQVRMTEIRWVSDEVTRMFIIEEKIKKPTGLPVSFCNHRYINEFRSLPRTSLRLAQPYNLFLLRRSLGDTSYPERHRKRIRQECSSPWSLASQ